MGGNGATRLFPSPIKLNPAPRMAIGAFLSLTQQQPPERAQVAKESMAGIDVPAKLF